MNKSLVAYQSVLKKWPKLAGPKPKVVYINNVLKLGSSRLGSLDTIAVAMAMRSKGVTQDQIILALGAPHRNKILKLAREKLIKLIKDRSGSSMNYKASL